MKRLINPRIFLFCAVGLVLGILCGHAIMFGNWLPFGILVGVFALTFVVLLLRKNNLRQIVLFTLIFTLVGTGLFQLKILDDQRHEIVAKQVNLEGRVTDIGRLGNATNVLYLENCTFEDVKIPGRVKVVVYDGQLFQTGDMVVVNGTLRSTYVFADEFDTSCLRNNCNYQLTDITVLAQRPGKLTLGEHIRLYIFNRCTNNMFFHADVMYALITGDTNMMDDPVKIAYQRAGMIHLVAVSGMHLVYIISIIGFFINKLKLNPLAEFAVMIGPLVFFCYVCNWAPSILRALLMTVCTYLVRWISGRYDMLIALSWSVLALLLFNPYYLFDVGWQLSVLSVFGMATLHLRIDRFLKSKKLNKFVYGLLSAISVSFSCTVATFATTAHFFGEVPILGVFANLIGVPLMSWAFTAGLVGLLPWVFKYALHLADGILWIVTQVATVVSSFDFAVATLSAMALAIAVTVVLLFVVGQYVNANKNTKVVVKVALLLVLVVCFVLAGVKLPCQNQVFASINFSGADVVVTNHLGDVVVVSNCQNHYSFGTICDYLQKYKHKSVTWVFTDFSKLDTTIPMDDFSKLGVDKVYNLSHKSPNKALEYMHDLGIPVVQVANNQTVGNGITVQSVYDGQLVGVVVRMEELTFAIVDGSEAQVEHFQAIVPMADFYVMERPTANYLQQNVVTFSLYQDYCATNYGANKYGNFTIAQKDGTIVVNF